MSLKFVLAFFASLFLSGAIAADKEAIEKYKPAIEELARNLESNSTRCKAFYERMIRDVEDGFVEATDAIAGELYEEEKEITLNQHKYDSNCLDSFYMLYNHLGDGLRNCLPGEALVTVSKNAKLLEALLVKTQGLIGHCEETQKGHVEECLANNLQRYSDVHEMIETQVVNHSQFKRNLQDCFKTYQQQTMSRFGNIKRAFEECVSK